MFLTTASIFFNMNNLNTYSIKIKSFKSFTLSDFFDKINTDKNLGGI